jgi:hypothetical protein
MALVLLKRAHVHLPPEYLKRAERIAKKLKVSKCKVIREACIFGLDFVLKAAK